MPEFEAAMGFGIDIYSQRRLFCSSLLCVTHACGYGIKFLKLIKYYLTQHLLVGNSATLARYKELLETNPPTKLVSDIAQHNAIGKTIENIFKQ